MRRESPFVQVYTSDADTFVHIRQFIYSSYDGESMPSESQDGVMMTLMQFRSLMFHLRALDSQFTQRAETTNAVKEEECINDDTMTRAGAKRSWEESEGNVAAAHLTNENVDGGNVVLDEIAERAWNELDTLLAPFKRSDETTTSDVTSVVPVKSEPDDLLDELMYISTSSMDPQVPEEETSRVDPDRSRSNQIEPDRTRSNKIEPIKQVAMKPSQVQNELAIVFAEEMNEHLLEKVVKDTCYGCKNGIDKDANPHQHDVCTLTRKARIDRCSEAALRLCDEVKVHQKLSARLLSRNVVFTKVYADVHTLITNKKWMDKLKKHVFEM